MVKRRNILIGSLGVPLLPFINTGCSDSVSASNPYLTGNYAPVDVESTVTNLQVTVTIPAELEVRFLRNGPNPIDIDPGDYHWFTGRGMVHGLRLRGGQAEWYRNRYVGNGANTNVIGHAGHTLGHGGLRHLSLPPPGPGRHSAPHGPATYSTTGLQAGFVSERGSRGTSSGPHLR